MTAVQPADTGQRTSRLAAPVLAGAAFLGAIAVLHLRDPHEPGSYAYCPVYLLTGGYCPGCGGLRAVHDLTHGQLAEAASTNLLVVGLVLPLAVVLWLTWTRARWRGRTLTSPLLTRPVVWSVLVVVLAFGFVRNLPFGSWFAP